MGERKKCAVTMMKMAISRHFHKVSLAGWLSFHRLYVVVFCSIRSGRVLLRYLMYRADFGSHRSSLSGVSFPDHEIRHERDAPPRLFNADGTGPALNCHKCRECYKVR